MKTNPHFNFCFVFTFIVLPIQPILTFLVLGTHFFFLSKYIDRNIMRNSNLKLTAVIFHRTFKVTFENLRNFSQRNVKQVEKLKRRGMI